MRNVEDLQAAGRGFESPQRGTGHPQRRTPPAPDTPSAHPQRPPVSLTWMFATAIGTVCEPSDTMDSMEFTAAITHEDPWYVARCLDVEVASQGETAEEALANLKEALELYFEDEVLPDGLEPPIIASLRLTA